MQEMYDCYPKKSLLYSKNQKKHKTPKKCNMQGLTYFNLYTQKAPVCFGGIGLKSFCGSESVMGIDLKGRWPIIFFIAVIFVSLIILGKIIYHWREGGIDIYHASIAFWLLVCSLLCAFVVSILFDSVGYAVFLMSLFVVVASDITRVCNVW